MAELMLEAEYTDKKQSTSSLQQMLQSQKLESKYYKPQVKSLMVHKRLYNLIPVTYINSKKEKKWKGRVRKKQNQLPLSRKGKEVI